MRLVVVGLSHHTAPVELREKFAVSAEGVPGVLGGLREQGLATEAVLVSTCNRVELCAVPADGVSAQDIASWLAARSGVRVRTAAPHLFQYEAQEALRHVFRVASSLDSMIVGEPQILGQFKDAYRLAMDAGATGVVLNKVMDRTLTVAKRVLTQTGIGREAVSMGRAGVELARQVLGRLDGRSALLIGAGAHGKLVARSLLSYGLGELIVANRTFARAAELAERFGGTATHLDETDHYLRQVDVVITSTGAGRVLLDRRSLGPVMRRRRYRSLVLIDLSVPRNIDPSVNALDGAFYFNVDDLAGVARQGHERRREAADAAESLVQEEAEAAWRMLMGESVRAGIGGVVRRAEQVRQAELRRAAGALQALGPEQRAAVDAMTRAIVKKVLHPPISTARRLAQGGHMQDVDLLLGALGAKDAPPPLPRKRAAPDATDG